VLDSEGFTPVQAHTAAAARREIVGREPALVVLDIGLPDLDGLALLVELRRRSYHGPVIILTIRGALDSKLAGFQAGADDYLVKPFEPLELVARIRNTLRHAGTGAEPTHGDVLGVGDVVLEFAAHTYRSAAVEPVALAPTELRILQLLMRHPRVALSRDTRIEQVWGYDYYGESNPVDVYIDRMRRKIEPDPTQPRYLHTMRGVGYMFHPGRSAEDADGDAGHVVASA
jgi:DNA-binding response OmpR family regulator